MSGLANLTKARRRWILDRLIDAEPLMAECGTSDDRKLAALTRIGVLTNYDCAFGNNYYHITDAGRAALSHNGTRKER